MTDPESRTRLCGVRLQRRGRVVFVDADGHDVLPSQVVAVDLAGRETLASVVFGPSQLLVNEPGVSPAGRLLRPATHDESVGFTRAHNDAREPAPRTEWLVEPGAEAVVRLATDQGESSAAEVIERLFPSERREASRRTTGSPGTPGEE